MYVVRHCLLMLLIVGVSWTTVAQAQSPCPNDFSRISSECMAASNATYKPLQIPVNAALKGNIYFYKTANGLLGKLKVIYTTTSVKECGLFRCRHL